MLKSYANHRITFLTRCRNTRLFRRLVYFWLIVLNVSLNVDALKSIKLYYNKLQILLHQEPEMLMFFDK